MMSRYENVKVLGRGTFGKVTLVKDKEDSNKLKALKTIAHNGIESSIINLIQEASILANLKHQNIVEFHANFLDEHYFYILTEYCEGGALFYYLRRYQENSIVEGVIVKWLKQITAAVKYLHSKNVIHRDIKTLNLLMKGDVLKLCDFGVSKVLENTIHASSDVGTAVYQSPEVIDGKKYTKKYDLWCIGICLYEMCKIDFPFQTHTEILRKPVPYLEHYSQDLNQILNSLLSKDPFYRFNIEELEKSINSLKIEEKEFSNFYSENDTSEEVEYIIDKVFDVVDSIDVYKSKQKKLEKLDKSEYSVMYPSNTYKPTIKPPTVQNNPPNVYSYEYSPTPLYYSQKLLSNSGFDEAYSSDGHRSQQKQLKLIDKSENSVNFMYPSNVYQSKPTTVQNTHLKVFNYEYSPTPLYYSQELLLYSDSDEADFPFQTRTEVLRKPVPFSYGYSPTPLNYSQEPLSYSDSDEVLIVPNSMSYMEPLSLIPQPPVPLPVPVLVSVSLPPPVSLPVPIPISLPVSMSVSVLAPLPAPPPFMAMNMPPPPIALPIFSSFSMF